METRVSGFNVLSVRREFPALGQWVHGQPLVYLDSAATTQKPRSVIEAETDFYRQDNANVHRGVHWLSQKATDQFEAVREKLAAWVGAEDSSCVIWTKGCTEAINLVAQSWGSNLQPGDVILLSAMEHHANIVPWQMVAQRTGAMVLPFPMNDEGEVELDKLEQLLKDHPVRLVGVKHVCNALGTVNPIAEIARLAHGNGALILVDGAQSVGHLDVDVTRDDIDFFTVSAHKAYGPTGVGALVARKRLLQKMPPWQGGGDMIRTVSWEGTTFNDLPNKFEPGTPNIAGVIGFGAALDFLGSLDLKSPVSEAAQYENELLRYGAERLLEIDGLKIHGTAEHKLGVLSFTLPRAHPHDIGTILDRQGIAIRTGHHCCMPLMKRLGVPATARASLSIYTTKEEIDSLVTGLHKVREVFE